MSRSAVEIDFFQMEKEKPPPPPSSSSSSSNMLFGRRRSFRDIQSVVSKMNTDLLKTVIASGSVEINSVNFLKSSEDGDALASKGSVPVPVPEHDESLSTALSVLSTPPVRGNTSGIESTTESTPLTIFYNGTVTVFDVPRHKAEDIFKLAVSSNDQSQILDTLNGERKGILGADLPIARRKSLRRFLEKRKERVTLVSPYGGPTDGNGNAFSV